MKGISTFDYKGKQIFLLNLSDLTLNDRAEFKKHIAYARDVIQKQPSKSVLIITDTTNTKFDSDFVDTLKEYAKHNNPYIKASALVGLTGLQKIIFYGVKTFTGRDFYIAKDLTDAQEWLVRTIFGDLLRQPSLMSFEKETYITREELSIFDLTDNSEVSCGKLFLLQRSYIWV